MTPERLSYISIANSKRKGECMIVTAICPECGDIIEEQECQAHPDTNLITYRSAHEEFVGQAIEDYLYGDNA